MRKCDVLNALSVAGGEIEQVLAVLAAAGVADPRRLPVARGDRELLAIHRELTGAELELTVACPMCRTVNAVALTPETVPPEHERVAWLHYGGVRAPTYEDLCGLPPGAAEARSELARRCVVGAPAAANDPGLLDLVDDSLAGPLVVCCSGCGQGISAPLDVERAVLEALQRAADDLDVEIHLLARAYHWELATIESLPDERRTRLAELVETGR